VILYLLATETQGKRKVQEHNKKQRSNSLLVIHQLGKYSL